jgi:hypothetical protein
VHTNLGTAMSHLTLPEPGPIAIRHRIQWLRIRSLCCSTDFQNIADTIHNFQGSVYNYVLYCICAYCTHLPMEKLSNLEKLLYSIQCLTADFHAAEHLSTMVAPQIL